MNVNTLTTFQIRLNLYRMAPDARIPEEVLTRLHEEGKKLNWNFRMLALRLMYVARHPEKTILVPTVITK